jgi:hypothetical protein
MEKEVREEQKKMKYEIRVHRRKKKGREDRKKGKETH